MTEAEKGIREKLSELQDTGYQEFQRKLMPTIPPQRVIGVRTPALRKYARELSKTEQAEAFLKQLPHKYYEENNLHGFLIEQIRDYDTLIVELDRFLPYVDNWATCDEMSPVIFKKHPENLRKKIKEWMASDQVYTVRFGIGMLLRFYLDDAFTESDLREVSKVQSEEYYIRMMVAWYFATALAKQYESTVPYLEKQQLEKWTHNKTIQKAIESYRVTDPHKEYLRTLRIK
jgi:3-methyladenine DNA glycosylase AlkD